MTPSPFSRLASATASGLVSTASQVVAGIKTFAATIIASAGIQVGSLFNTNGTGASDKGVVIGFATSDGSVNGAAAMLVGSTGIGGTQVDRFHVLRGLQANGFALGAPGVAGTLTLNNSIGWSLAWNTMSAIVDGGAVTISESSTQGPIFRVTSAAAINVKGTDSTGTPGAVTINKPIGKSAIAAGASSVVITNSLATAASVVLITQHARDATCKELIAVAAAGSFTVSGTANATAALPFSFEVKGIL